MLRLLLAYLFPFLLLGTTVAQPVGVVNSIATNICVFFVVKTVVRKMSLEFITVIGMSVAIWLKSQLGLGPDQE